MKRYEILLLDLDDTILDFSAAEAEAYARTLGEHGLPRSREILERYHQVNMLWWEKLERGEAEREEILLGRHRQMFRELGLQADPLRFELDYRRQLGEAHDLLPGAKAALDYLKGRGYRLFLASNGLAETQHSRLRGAGIGPYFEGSFISEELGANKPEPAFFEACFARIPGFSREKTLMVGDSLSSDILGGRRAGIDTLWLNRRGSTAPPDCRPSYEIASLEELPKLL